MPTTPATPVAVAGHGAGHLETRGTPPRELRAWPTYALLAFGLLVAVVNLADPSEVARSVVFNGLGVLAVVTAAFGVVRNRPARADGVVARRHEPRAVRPRRHRLRRDGARIRARLRLPLRRRHVPRGVPVPRRGALPTVDHPIPFATPRSTPRSSPRPPRRSIWQWIVKPLLESTNGSALERIIVIAYPIMDILLVIAMVHAVFASSGGTRQHGYCSVPRRDASPPTSRTCSSSPTAQTARARPRPAWPIVYLTMGAAALHPSMRRLWEEQDEPASSAPAPGSRLSVPRCSWCQPSSSSTISTTSTAARDRARGDHGRRRGTGGVADLASRRRRERRRVRSSAESEARFRVLVQNATDIVVGAGVQRRDGYSSPAIDDILGCPPEAVIGTNANDLVHPDDLDRRRQGDRGAARITDPSGDIRDPGSQRRRKLPLDPSHVHQPAGRAVGATASSATSATSTSASGPTASPRARPTRSRCCSPAAPSRTRCESCWKGSTEYVGNAVRRSGSPRDETSFRTMAAPTVARRVPPRRRSLLADDARRASRPHRPGRHGRDPMISPPPSRPCVSRPAGTGSARPGRCES